MPEDLDEIHARIEFSREQIVELGRSIKADLESRLEITQSINADNTYNIDARILRDIPIALLIRAGQVAHELRGCLDALACVLATRAGALDVSKTAFAICKDEASFRKDGQKLKLRALSQTDRDKIASLKPYGPDNKLLWGLHVADLAKKHRRLMRCSLANTQGYLGGLVRGSGTIHVGTLTVKGNIVARDLVYSPTKLNEVPLGQSVRIGQNIPIGLEFGFDFACRYCEPEELRGKDVIVVLREFTEEVDRIVNLF